MGSSEWLDHWRAQSNFNKKCRTGEINRRLPQVRASPNPYEGIGKAGVCLSGSPGVSIRRGINPTSEAPLSAREKKFRGRLHIARGFAYTPYNNKAVAM